MSPATPELKVRTWKMDYKHPDRKLTAHIIIDIKQNCPRFSLVASTHIMLSKILDGQSAVSIRNDSLGEVYVMERDDDRLIVTINWLEQDFGQIPSVPIDVNKEKPQAQCQFSIRPYIDHLGNDHNIIVATLEGFSVGRILEANNISLLLLAKQLTKTESNSWHKWTLGMYNLHVYYKSYNDMFYLHLTIHTEDEVPQTPPGRRIQYMLD